MKGKTFFKISIVLLTVVIMLSLSAVAVFAEETGRIDTTVQDRINNIVVNQGRSPSQQADYLGLRRQMQLESDLSYIRATLGSNRGTPGDGNGTNTEDTKKSPTVNKKEELIKWQNLFKDVIDNLPGFITMCKNTQNGGDFDTSQLISVVSTIAIDIASLCPPYGTIIAGGIDIVSGLITAIMGGEAATSDLAQMEDRLNQQLDNIQNHLSEIEEQISDLSDQINDATNKIIQATTAAIDNADAKQYLRTFMLSGEGNFSYNDYRNHIYGTVDGNSKSNTAYYSWLNYYIGKGDYNLVKEYYDLLYKSLIDGWSAYKDYIIGASIGKSIVKYYYDVVSANPNLIEDSTMSPELSAIMFAYDIYQTELMVDQLISTCNFYQYTYLALNSASDNEDENPETEKKYVYDEYNKGFVTQSQLEWGIAEQIDKRLKEVENQLAKDVAYILSPDNSFIVKTTNGKFYEVENNDSETFGHVLADQTIYLNTIPDEICELFNIEKSDFNYTVDNITTKTDGVIYVDSNASSFTATLNYKGTPICNIVFSVGSNAKFNGGSGTASDPYLIASTAQFKSISDGVDQHYRLICDIDFENEEISPIGQRQNSNDSIVYDEFTGSLDGNGYKIRNLNILGNTYSGLFGVIGEQGEVANLKLYNVKVTANISNAEKSTSNFFAGVIAGKNNGVIKYCSVDSDGKTNLDYYKEEHEQYSIKTLFDSKNEITSYVQDEYYKYVFLNHMDDVLKSVGWSDKNIQNFLENMKNMPDFLFGYWKSKISKYLETQKVTSIKEGINEFFDSPYYGLTLIIDNEVPNRCIYSYVGGISGENNNTIAYCILSNNIVLASSTHNFGGDSTNQNENNVYVGGISGFNHGILGYSIVNENVSIFSYAKSIYNPTTTVNPYVISYAGGVVADTDSLSNIYKVKSTVSVIQSACILDCKSKYGEHYKNSFSENDTYIPKYLDDDLTAIKVTQEDDIEDIIANPDNPTAELYIPNEESAIYYSAGNDTFKTEILKCKVDGEETTDFDVLNIYGFNAQNALFESVDCPVIVLFSVEKDGETLYFSQEITAKIEANKIESVEILDIKSYYVGERSEDSQFSTTFSPLGLKIKYNYAVGSDSVEITSDNIKNIAISGDINGYGTQELKLSYEDVDNPHFNIENVQFEIYVVCGHRDNFTSPESGYSFYETKASTCKEYGYRAYVCDTCGDIKYIYIKKEEHIPDYENVVDSKSATCTEEGNTGKICCKKCGETIIDGEIISKLEHDYKYLNENKHLCSSGHSESHHYTVTESTQFLDLDNDGVKKWYLVYAYTCICKNENGEFYSYTVVDQDSILEENKILPTIVVSNGYVTNRDKEVVVFVQFINNPGLKSACFGIRYDRGLELVGTPQIDNLFKNLTVTETEQIDYGYNFVFVNEKMINDDGNLIKLTFNVPNTAKVGDIFNISVVYNNMGKTVDGQPIVGGFSDGEQIKVITRDGYVKVVGEGQLPGDVNNDNTVDLLDVIRLAKFYVNSEKYPLHAEDADIDLDGAISPDDIVLLLEYIVGAYGKKSIMTQNFDISLNTNGYDEFLEDLHVSIYEDDNNTYAKAGLCNLYRTGYKFLGWYDQIYGGNLIYGGDLTGEVQVKYNPNQYKQTLYAHWELNQIIFDSNGATSGEMETIYYSEDTSLDIQNTYKKEYKVAFISGRADIKNHYTSMEYEFSCWYYNDDIKFDSLKEALYYLQNSNCGRITLKAIWSETPFITYPEGWDVDGYEPVKWEVGSKIKTEIQNNNDIFEKGEQENGYYLVYAKYTPIEYSIMLNFNGGKGTDGNNPGTYSVGNSYDLSRVSASKVGYELVSWTVYVDNELYKDFSTNETIGYLPNAKQNSEITVKANWNEKEYIITYELDGGTFSDSKLIPSFKISQIDEMNLPTPTYSKYTNYNTFMGWYMDKDCTEEFNKDSLKENPKDLILYAKWNKFDKCYDFTNTPQKIEANRVIVDWSEDSTGSNTSNSTIYVNNISEIYFIGNPNLVYDNIIIVFSAGNSTNAGPIIHFENFNINGYHCEADANITVPLNPILDIIGSCSINSTNNSAISGFKSLKFTGDGTLNINVSLGANCEAIPVSVDDMSIDENCNVSINLLSELKSSDDVKNNSQDFYNGYVFKEWLGDGEVCGNRIEKVEDMRKTFKCDCYAPLKLERKDINDLKDIGSSESVYLYISGGSGEYLFSCDFDSEKIEVTYDVNTSKLSIKKEQDSKSGKIQPIFTDENSGQRISIEIEWSTSGGCFTGDTLVTLADGSLARLDSLSVGDLVMSWNPILGEFEAMPIAYFVNHGEDYYNVITLTFENDKSIKVVTEHGFFDTTLNKYVYINSDNFTDYIGHEFASLSELGSFEKVRLVSAECSYDYSSCYSLLSSCNNNAIVEGFLTLTPEDVPGFFSYFEFGEDFKYDKAQMESDIETYGLYSYEEWSEFVTYEQFVAFNGQYLKIVVGKGYLTVDDIIEYLTEMLQ